MHVAKRRHSRVMLAAVRRHLVCDDKRAGRGSGAARALVTGLKLAIEFGTNLIIEIWYFGISVLPAVLSGNEILNTISVRIPIPNG